MLRLLKYPWPGNIRELQNVIERAVVLSQTDSLELAPDFGSQPIVQFTRGETEQATHRTPVASYPQPSTIGALVDIERQHIEQILSQTNWMIEGERGAAKILDLSPSTLRSRMQKLGIKRPSS